MTKYEETELALSPYRILDLTEGGCMVGGKILGDLGADVIKIELPGGSTSRIAPFYKDIADPEKSLFWFAYNTNKRGITLNIETNKGWDIFKKLLLTADAVIESFDPGLPQQHGLRYEELTKVKPNIILTSISPFGQDGPKSHYKGSDLTAWASGGYLYICFRWGDSRIQGFSSTNQAKRIYKIRSKGFKKWGREINSSERTCSGRHNIFRSRR